MRGGPGVQRDRLVERVHRLGEAAQALLRLRLLEPGGVGLGVELECLARVVERLVRIARAVVVGAQAHVGGDEAALPLPVERDGLLVPRDRARVVAQRLEREAEGVQRLEVDGSRRTASSSAFRAGSQLSWTEKSLPRL